MMQEFVESVKKTAQKVVENIHTAVPAEIISYNADTGMAVVQPKAQFKKPTGEMVDYPQISGVPVVFPQSKNVSIAFPVVSGDGCLLVFSETALDYWQYGNETDTDLKFDLSSAIAIPNICSTGKEAMKIACAENAAVLKTDEVILKVKSDGVYIVGNLSVSGNLDVAGNITSSGGTMSITNGKTNISGTLQIDGSVSASNDVSAGGVSLKQHRHEYDGGMLTTEPVK